MKKTIKIIALLSAVMMLLASMCVYATKVEETVITLQIGNPMMTVNGVSAEIDPGRGTGPVAKDGRTLVPIRAIIEAMGGDVTWNGETSQVVLTYKEDVIKLVIDSPRAYFNETETILDVAPTAINERTMLPIRYIAESFKFTVGWDGETSTVTVSKVDYPDDEAAKSDAAAEPEYVPVDSFDIFTDPEHMTDSEYEEVIEIDPEDEELMYPEEDAEDGEVIE